MQSGITAPSRARQVSLIFLAALSLLFTGLVAPSAGAVAPSSQPLANKTITAKVDRVLSGERIRVKKGKRKYTVTLADIDAPTGSDCYATESKSGLQSLLPKGTSVIVSISKKRKRRITGIVYSGATNINATMVGEGLAESDGGPSDFSSLEAEASASGKGLHGSCSSSAGDDSSGSSSNSGSSSSGNSNSSGSGSSSGSSNEYTAAQKQEIISRYSQNLVGLEVSFSTGDGNVTDTYGISFCTPTTYSLFQITSFSGSGSTSSQHVGTWKIIEAGGVPNQTEIVRISYTPSEPGRSPFLTDIGQVAGGAVLVNNRQAGLSRSTRC